jgi:hypothetical protein
MTTRSFGPVAAGPYSWPSDGGFSPAGTPGICIAWRLARFMSDGPTEPPGFSANC